MHLILLISYYSIIVKKPLLMRIKQMHLAPKNVWTMLFLGESDRLVCHFPSFMDIESQWQASTLSCSNATKWSYFDVTLTLNPTQHSLEIHLIQPIGSNLQFDSSLLFSIVVNRKLLFKFIWAPYVRAFCGVNTSDCSIKVSAKSL